ncbi:Uncharacterised protein [Legionella bozemanae]|nr:Uncharacterised protein [Legionella bozemanae]
MKLNQFSDILKTEFLWIVKEMNNTFKHTLNVILKT